MSELTWNGEAIVTSADSFSCYATLDGYDCTCYAHVGQHSGCSMGWYHKTRAAKPEEYADLQRELESAPYGYRFKIYNRIQPWMRTARFKKALRLRARSV